VRMERDFLLKCDEFLNNEKILKQNMEVLQKYSEELERERTNERTLRLKLEEEYMQNSKNHEEEVQLRLKFESKLNSMHSRHRELEIKHKRLISDYDTAE
jgi:septal ring factor EnvC (AmiA/AmiB activator)